MADADIDLSSDLQHLPYIQFSHMVNTLQIILTVWESFVMWLVVVVAFPDTGESCYSKWSKADDVGSPEIVDIRCDPPSIIEFPEMTTCFMVSAHKKRQVGGLSFTAVIFVKISDFSKFKRNRHAIQIK